MSEIKKDQQRDVDAVLAWNHRIADQSDISDDLLPELSDEERTIFADGEEEFLKKLLADELGDEDNPAATAAPEIIFTKRVASQPVGLNRAKSLSVEVKDVLDRQRQELINHHQKAGHVLANSEWDVPDINPEKEATTILKDMGLWELPVDPRRLACLLYTSPSPRDATLSRMPSSA